MLIALIYRMMIDFSVKYVLSKYGLITYLVRMEIEDEEEVTSLKDYQLVTLVSHSNELVRALVEPVESVLEFVHGLIESLQLRVFEIIVV